MQPISQFRDGYYKYKSQKCLWIKDEEFKVQSTKKREALNLNSKMDRSVH